MVFGLLCVTGVVCVSVAVASRAVGKDMPCATSGWFWRTRGLHGQCWHALVDVQSEIQWYVVNKSEHKIIFNTRL